MLLKLRSSSMHHLYNTAILILIIIVSVIPSALAEQKLTFSYVHGDDKGELDIYVVDPISGKSTSLEKIDEDSGVTTFSYSLNSSSDEYYLEKTFRLRWISLPTNHSAKIREPVELQIPVRFRSKVDISREFRFEIFRDFTSTTANRLDSLTRIDVGTKLLNSGLGAKYFSSRSGKTATNWARIWFDAAFELAQGDVSDFYQMPEDAYSNLHQRLADDDADALWSRYMELASRFVQTDGPAFESALAAKDCVRARIILKALEEKNKAESGYFEIARSGEEPEYYLGEKRKQIEKSCVGQ